MTMVQLQKKKFCDMNVLGEGILYSTHNLVKPEGWNGPKMFKREAWKIRVDIYSSQYSLRAMRQKSLVKKKKKKKTFGSIN